MEMEKESRRLSHNPNWLNVPPMMNVSTVDFAISSRVKEDFVESVNLTEWDVQSKSFAWRPGVKIANKWDFPSATPQMT